MSTVSESFFLLAVINYFICPLKQQSTNISLQPCLQNSLKYSSEILRRQILKSSEIAANFACSFGSESFFVKASQIFGPVL